jgi:hypothetical protein
MIHIQKPRHRELHRPQGNEGAAATIIDLGGGDRIRLVGIETAMRDTDDFDISL